MKAFQALFTENKKFDIEYRVQRKDGVWVWLHDRSMNTYEKEGKRYADGVFSDITERKRAEEEINKLNEELKRNIVQLEAANKELEAFSYSVSHDLRAPLRAIDGFSRVVLEDYTGKLDDEGKRYLNIIRGNTKKMGQLIDDLLLFSRLGRQELRASGIDMGKLAKAVSEELKLAVPERKLKFTINTLIPAQGDQAMIRQVFVNLLSNAVKFTRPKETAMIEIGGQNEGSENIYYVRDNGVGFDMQYVNKLFGVFQRLHSSEEFEGTGVGLAIVQRIIHRHGGRAWAEGKVGEGAAFYFSLPRGTRDEGRGTIDK
jgi:light-regulated signal transduction histidine kinase (bacteriophytochrome)